MLNNVVSGNAFGTVSFIVGGLAGRVSGMEGFVKIDMTACSASGSIDIAFTNDIGDRVVGGLVGGMEYAAAQKPPIGGSIGPVTFGITAFASGVNIVGCYAEMDITCNYDPRCGGLIAYGNIKSVLNVSDCYTTGNIVMLTSASASDVGGFLGWINMDSGSIANCYTTVNITAIRAGGFARKLNCKNSLNITDCYAAGNVFSGWGGGFCYEAYNVNFYRCYSTGIVQGTKVSGFIYQMYNDEPIIIEECFTTGDIRAATDAAGLIYGTDQVLIKNCYSKSDIYFIANSVNITVHAAGLVYDMDGILMNCYYSGKITAVLQYHGIKVGALTLFTYADTRIINCHWLQAEGGLATVAVLYDDSLQSDHVAYSDIADMYELADALNADQDETVWVNIPNGTPQLKFMSEV
ncbi:hypothetical protein FACS1894211_03050 [Clostridia bacterium]|nr:hypothetical protein FACS1894211_03050 [Clostridia bacterium]